MYLPADTDPIAAKTLYAAELLRTPHDPFKAALKVFPHHMQACLWVMQAWVHDEFVLSEQRRLIEHFGPDHFLPTMQDLAHHVYATAVGASMTDDKIKAFELYAKIRGFINKPAEAANVNVNVSNKVLVIREYSEAEVEASQAKLLREAAEDVG